MCKVSKISALLLALLVLTAALFGCGKPAEPAAGSEDSPLFGMLGQFQDKTAGEPEQVKPFKNLAACGIDGLNKGMVVQDNIVTFTDMKDMDTVLSNQKLRKEYKERFDIELPKYYYYPKYCDEHWNESGVSLSWYNGDFVIMPMYYTKKRDGLMWILAIGKGDGNVNETDQNELETHTVTHNGREIEWVFIEKNSFGVKCTAYSWNEGGFLGLVYMAGEHADKNLEYCQLVRRDITLE